MSRKDEYLSVEWQKLRLQVLNRDDFKCRLCGAKDKQLHIHHIYYIKDKKIYDYDIESLISLCSDCHKVAHNELAKISGLIAFSVLAKRNTFIDVQEFLKNGGLI